MSLPPFIIWKIMLTYLVENIVLIPYCIGWFDQLIVFTPLFKFDKI